MDRLSLTAEVVRKELAYNPETGDFVRLVSHAQRRIVGRIAGSNTTTGYRRICIAGYVYKAHRLAWLVTYGEWPDGQIDHINGIRTDNRLANLRVVSNRENGENKRHATASNKSGYLGVSWHKTRRRWRAEIKHKGKREHLGLFDTPEQAFEAYVQRKRVLHSACTI